MTSHVASESKILAGLCGSPIHSILQIYDTLTCSKLLFRELSRLLLCWLRAETRARVLRVKVALKYHNRHLVKQTEKTFSLFLKAE